MGIYQALKGPEVQVLTRQEDIDTGFVRGCGTRCTDIKPVENPADQSASIKTSSTEHTGDVKQFYLSSFEFEPNKGILKHKFWVKTLGASRR